MFLRKSGLKKDIGRWSNSIGGSDIEVALVVPENVVKRGDGSGVGTFLAKVLHSIQVSAGLIHLGLCP